MAKEVIRDTDGVIVAIAMRNVFGLCSIGYYVNFVTCSEDNLQLASMNRQEGEKINRHKHTSFRREISGTGEVLIVIKGKIIVELYGSNKQPLKEVTLIDGEAIVLMGGGHAINIIEDTEMYEVKQGPYAGENDKEYF
jgi:uncharacterized protein YjlB